MNYEPITIVQQPPTHDPLLVGMGFGLVHDWESGQETRLAEVFVDGVRVSRMKL